MTHYYIYIAAGQVLDESAQFYRVAVGNTAQVIRDYNYLVEYANKHGHYFQKWSSQVDDFLNNIANNFPHAEGECSATILNIRHVYARELVRLFKHGDALSLKLNVEVNSRQLREYLSINYRIYARRSL